MQGATDHAADLIRVATFKLQLAHRDTRIDNILAAIEPAILEILQRIFGGAGQFQRNGAFHCHTCTRGEVRLGGRHGVAMQHDPSVEP